MLVLSDVKRQYSWPRAWGLMSGLKQAWRDVSEQPKIWLVPFILLKEEYLTTFISFLYVVHLVSCVFWIVVGLDVINNFQKYLYLFRGSPKENKGFLWSMPVTVGCVSCSVVLFIWECVGCDQVQNEGLLYQILPCGGWNFFSVLFAPIESIILLIWGKDEQKKLLLTCSLISGKIKIWVFVCLSPSEH